MSEKQIIEEILVSEEFKLLLRDYLAQKVSKEYNYRDTEGELIKTEVRELVKMEAKSMIKEVVEDYYEMEDIKTQIEKIMGNLTKEEIINFLRKKL